MTAEPTPEARGLDSLATEDVRDELSEIDLASTAELVGAMNAEDRTVPEAVAAAAPAIVDAVDAVTASLAAGGRLLYVGAGTSGRLGTLDAVECPPTFDTEPGQVLGVLAGGEKAFEAADEGAEDDEGAGQLAVVENRVEATDAVVGISASGRSPYVLGAIAAAAARGATTIGISCNRLAPLSAAVDHPVEIETGPEFLAGSTRLKAGTAQKLVLNMISTIAMIRIGKTYGNLMVDVRATNAKLRARAVRIVEQAAAVDAELARTTLARTNGDAKAAIVVLRLGVAPAEAVRLLAANAGHLRQTLAEAGS